MKTKNLTIALMALSIVFGASSCKKKGCTDDSAKNYNEKAKKDDGTCEYDPILSVLSGEITEDRTLTYLDENGNVAEYTLAGGVHVKSGATLTIEPGVIVKSDPNEAVAYLLIEQGAKILAEGTADEPIVFTSGKDTPARGDWGGIIVNGYAPINKGTTATAEVGDVLYGGSNVTDNSGILKYVRVEYTGNAINDEKEHNGFTFNGVGSGTTIDYLQAYMGGDDGFEWFGGTVSANHLVAYGCKDDSFDWTYGWVGSGNEWIATQSSDAGDRGIEADNQSGANGATPFSNPTLTNITLTGRGVTAATAGATLREGTKANIDNIKIDGFATGLVVQHDQTLDNTTAGSLKVTKLTVSNFTTAVKYTDSNSTDTDTSKQDAASASGNVNNDGTGTGASTSWVGAWVKSL